MLPRLKRLVLSGVHRGAFMPSPLADLAACEQLRELTLDRLSRPRRPQCGGEEWEDIGESIAISDLVPLARAPHKMLRRLRPLSTRTRPSAGCGATPGGYSGPPGCGIYAAARALTTAGETPEHSSRPQTFHAPVCCFPLAAASQLPADASMTCAVGGCARIPAILAIRRPSFSNCNANACYTWGQGPRQIRGGAWQLAGLGQDCASRLPKDGTCWQSRDRPLPEPGTSGSIGLTQF
jgi:hypothetical protein